MDLSGNKKTPNNPATIQSDAAGSPEKPIYQGEDDAHHFVPADEDRDTLPFSKNKQEQEPAEKTGSGEKEDPAMKPDNGSGPERADKGEQGDRENREGEAGKKDQDEDKPKDDVHSAPESGDKLP